MTRNSSDTFHATESNHLNKEFIANELASIGETFKFCRIGMVIIPVCGGCSTPNRLLNEIVPQTN